VSSADDRSRPDLKRLYDAHQWFQLRDAMRAKPDSTFYQAVLANAFNDHTRAEALLRAVIHANPQSDDAAASWQGLEDVFFRSGRYQHALTVTNEELRSKPDNAGLKGDRATFEAFPKDQSTAQREFSRFAYTTVDGGVFIPVSINGKSGDFAMDTDADMSVLSESEATRLGLAVRDSTHDVPKLQGAAGVQAGYRTAVADELIVGKVRLNHVAFLVLPDGQKPFADLPPGERGIIGIPVLLAFQTIRWTADGTFEIAFPPGPRDIAGSNLCFDGSDPITEVEFQKRHLEFIADTGDQGSDLFSPFAKDFAHFIDKFGKKQSLRVTGMDGSVEVPGIILPEVTLRVGGFPAVLHSARVELRQTAQNSQWYYGRVGMAIYRQAHQVTIDFRSMTLSLN
jgi:hypothetical protein